MERLRRMLSLLAGDPQADRVVPPTGFTARLTVLSAAAMALLCVHHNRIDRVGSDLPLPPLSFLTTCSISCILTFEHEALDAATAGALS